MQTFSNCCEGNWLKSSWLIDDVCVKFMSMDEVEGICSSFSNVASTHNCISSSLSRCATSNGSNAWPFLLPIDTSYPNSTLSADDKLNSSVQVGVKEPICTS